MLEVFLFSVDFNWYPSKGHPLTTFVLKCFLALWFGRSIMKVNGGWIFSWYGYFGYLLTHIFFWQRKQNLFSLHEKFSLRNFYFQIVSFSLDTSLPLFPTWREISSEVGNSYCIICHDKSCLGHIYVETKQETKWFYHWKWGRFIHLKKTATLFKAIADLGP